MKYTPVHEHQKLQYTYLISKQYQSHIIDIPYMSLLHINTILQQDNIQSDSSKHYNQNIFTLTMYINISLIMTIAVW